MDIAKIMQMSKLKRIIEKGDHLPSQEEVIETVKNPEKTLEIARKRVVCVKGYVAVEMKQCKEKDKYRITNFYKFTPEEYKVFEEKVARDFYKA
jgi:hypothetical protein